MTSSTDRIEKEMLLKATRARVWRALSDAEEFGSWFGAALKGNVFAPGAQVRGPITIAGFQHIAFDALIVEMEPEQRLAFRWHPYPIDAAVDYSLEERTLVVMTLSDAAGGTLLKVVESGFDKLPAARRAAAFHANSGGWEGQLRNVARHVDGA